MNIWVVVPAAGLGTRMKSQIPKQYLPLAGLTVISHSLIRVCACSGVVGGVVSISPEDNRWSSLRLRLSFPIHTVLGGSERAFSVLAALHYLEVLANPEDWVLVHDAARPCLRPSDVENLVSAVIGNRAVGGILALPVSDTVKRVDATGRILETIPRQGLWQALTPQMFRLNELIIALTAALARGETPTDESAAMEMAGYFPLVVVGHSDNIKITHPSDLVSAARFLKEQAKEGIISKKDRSRD